MSGTAAGAAIGVAPKLATVKVLTGLTVEAAFDESLNADGLDPTNYTLSGVGQGTLAAQPDSATLAAPGRYVLTWNSGEMLNGGDITITVSNVRDVAGNSIGADNIATAAKAGRDGLITVNIPARRDVTLFEDDQGALANGAGPNFFVGTNSDGLIRRGLIQFDVAGNIPEGSLVMDSTLRLRASGAVGTAAAQPVGLHLVTAPWTEGDVNAGDPGADGAPADADEATWIHSSYDTALWATPGGDFDPTARATTSVAGAGAYTWKSAEMLADTQAWLDDPASNEGWLLLGNESAGNTVKAFRSDEHITLSELPVFSVVFSLNGGPGGPTLGTIGDQEINEGETLTLELTANDTGGNPLSITSALASLPLGHNAVLTDHGDTTATFQWTPSFVDADSYVVTFIATQKGIANPLSISESIVIDVQEVNQAPALEEPEALVATEGVLSTVALVGSDNDVGDTLTYSLVLPIDGVELDGTTGVLRWTPGFSAAGVYDIGVRVVDNGEPPLSTTRTLQATVLDANGSPVVSPIENQIVVESEVLSFKVTAVDPDLADTLTFSLENSPAGTSIDSATGVFRWVPSITAAGEHEVTVVATDNGEPTMSGRATFGVTVVDDNRDPTNIALSPATVPENLPSGTLVGTFTTVDMDAGDVHAYSLVAGEGDTGNAAFTVSGNELRTNQAFDYETIPSYSIRVQSFDGKDGTFARAITVTIVNKNDLPTAIALDNASVVENVPVGTVVGRLNTTDPDRSDTHTYAIVSGDGDEDNDKFAISGRDLVVNGPIDFESKASLSVRLRSNDPSNGFVEASFQITVINENDMPDGVTLSNAQVAENAPANTEVGQFMTDDTDGASGRVYNLVSGQGSEDNGNFRISDGTLLTAVPLDFELKRMHSIRVRSLDGQQAPFEMVFTIEVLDRNDAPTNVAISSSGILGNVPADTVIGSLVTSDQDVDDSHTYALVSGEGSKDNDRFKVVGEQLLTDKRVNFDSNATFETRLRTTDAAGATFEKAFVLVNDDVDGDGLSDAWELANFGNLLASATDDLDGDGLSNLDEFLNRTNPNRADSDGDGVLDGDEVARGANPNNSNDAPAVLAVSPASAAMGREEGVITLLVQNTGIAPLNWEATLVTSSFAEIISGVSGSNTGEINVKLSTNLTSASRTATVRITAENAVGSPMTVTLNQSACSAPGRPNDVLATNGTLPGQVRVLWDAVEDADQYMVYRGQGSDPNAATLIATVVGTAYTDSSAPVLSTKQADGGGGCVPIINPDPAPNASAYQYWVRAMNVCGTGVFSDPDDGFPGAGQPPAMALFEPVVPGLETENRSLRARVDSVLAIRLRRDTAISPTSIRGEVLRATGTVTQVTWKAIDTEGLKDGWALYSPGDTPFELGESVMFTVSASTVAGENIGPLTYRFTIETEAEFLDRVGAGDTPVAQPSYVDFDASGIDLSQESQDEVVVYAVDEALAPAGLLNASGPAFAITPDAVYGQPQRVWLPLEGNLRASDVVVNYYFSDKSGNNTGWRQASQIAGWANMSSLLELEVGTERYIGFTVRHGGLVQLSATGAKDAPTSSAGAFPTTLIRFGGDGIVALLLLFSLAFLLPRMFRLNPR
tara:strand:+ start:20 stop:4822 length:4803 start_codon:yes stop_codon:yes gene_type:complete